MFEHIKNLDKKRYLIRKYFRHRRKYLSIKEQKKYSKQAALRLLTWPPILKINTISLFLSFDGEIDTRPLIINLWSRGKKIYLPTLDPFNSKNLVFIRYHPYTKLIMNKLKFYEPLFNIHDILTIKDLELIIVPLVAFDNYGNRLGMGKGFYDRVLQDWFQYNCKIIGYAYDFQYIDILPIKKWDIPLPLIITPSKYFTSNYLSYY